MPRFLAVDYLSEAVNYRSAELSRMLITSPLHLECVDWYPHKGILEDDAFRVPWLRAKCDSNFEDHYKCDSISQEISWLKSQHQSDEVEEYRDENLVQDAYHGTIEVVQSSNPESPPPSKDDIFNDIEITRKGIGEKEFFSIENLDNYMEEEGKSSFLLEDLEELDNFSNFLNHMPQLTNLMCRLKPKPVQDPFLDGDGKDISEQNIIRDCDLDISESKTIDEASNIQGIDDQDKENFQNVFILDSLEEPIEDELNTSMKEKPSNGNGNSVGALETLCHSEDLEPVVLEENAETQLVKEISSLSDEQEQPFDTQTLEAVVVSPVGQGQCVDFTAINSEGVNDGCKDNVLLLESPLDDHKKDDVQETTCVLEDLVPLEVSPVKSQSVLSPSSKDEIEQKLWISEKFFNDVITLARLPEPVESKKGIKIVDIVAEATGQLSLRHDNSVADTELNLSWDPIAASEKQMRIFSKVEMVSYSNSEHKPLRVSDYKIIWEKYDRAYFIDFRDELIKCKPQNDQRQTQENEDRKKTVDNISSATKLNAVPNVEGSKNLADICKNSKESKLHPTSPDILTGQQQKLKEFGKVDNPLDNFLLLRSVETASKTGATSLQCPEVPNSRVKHQEKNSGLSSATPPTPVTPGRDPKKPKTKSIEVKLTDKFSAIVCTFHMHAEPHLTTLKQRNLIPASHMFDSLTRDVTRFMLKQHEKSMQDSQEMVTFNGTYSAVVALHALVTATDNLVHCCLQSAIAILSAMQEKYKTILGDVLSNLRQELFKSQCQFQQEKVLHPKVAAMCANIANWYKRKKKVSFDQDPKILIILRRNLPSLRECVCEALSEVEDFQPFSMKELPTHQDVVDSLDHHNCIIVSTNQIGEDFSWAQFSLVMEYEQTDDSTLKELCQRQNIRYMSLKAVKGDTPNEIRCPEKGLQKAEISSHQFTFIGSEMVTTNTDLLHHLEAKCNIAIIERMYSKLSIKHKFYHADLVVDERTCIVLHDVCNLVEDNQVEPLVQKVLALSLKYEKCWIIICTGPAGKEKSRYSFAGRVGDNICKLYGSLTQVCSNPEQFSIEVNFVNSVSHAAEMIRQIGEATLQATDVWDKQEWVERSWLTEEMSEHERFLLFLPWFNTLSAQILLTASTLPCLMKMTLKDLTANVPWLPEKVLNKFHEFIHHESEVAINPLSLKDEQGHGKDEGSNDEAAGSCRFEDQESDRGFTDVGGSVCSDTGQGQSIAEVVSKSPLDFITNGYTIRSQSAHPHQTHETDFGGQNVFEKQTDISDENSLNSYSGPGYGFGHFSGEKVGSAKRSDEFDRSLPKRPKLFSEFSNTGQMHPSAGKSRVQYSPSMELGHGASTNAVSDCHENMKRQDELFRRNDGQSYMLPQDNLGSGDGLRQLIKTERLDSDDGAFVFNHGPDGDSVYLGGAQLKDKTQGNGEHYSRGSVVPSASMNDFAFSKESSSTAHHFTDPDDAHFVVDKSVADCVVDEPEFSQQWKNPDGRDQAMVHDQSGRRKRVYQSNGKSVAGLIEEVRQRREKQTPRENKGESVVNERSNVSRSGRIDGDSHLVANYMNQPSAKPQPPQQSTNTKTRPQQKSLEHVVSLGVSLPSDQAQQMRDFLSLNHRPDIDSLKNQPIKQGVPVPVPKGRGNQEVVSIKQEPIDVDSSPSQRTQVVHDRSQTSLRFSPRQISSTKHSFPLVDQPREYPSINNQPTNPAHSTYSQFQGPCSNTSLSSMQTTIRSVASSDSQSSIGPYPNLTYARSHTQRGSECGQAIVTSSSGADYPAFKFDPKSVGVNLNSSASSARIDTTPPNSSHRTQMPYTAAHFTAFGHQRAINPTKKDVHASSSKTLSHAQSSEGVNHVLSSAGVGKIVERTGVNSLASRYGNNAPLTAGINYLAPSSSYRTEMADASTHFTARSRPTTKQTRRIPGVAPVTPTVRRPLQALSLGIHGENQNMGIQGVREGREGASNWCHPYDSPPMDLESDDESSPEDCYSQIPGQTVVMTPQVKLRKRRLIYEKMPGAKDGQTRLTFV